MKYYVFCKVLEHFDIKFCVNVFWALQVTKFHLSELFRLPPHACAAAEFRLLSQVQGC